MKITCQSCQSKYTVSDEKVQGRTVKIKCRKCGATILVNSSGVTTNGGIADPVSASSGPSDGSTFLVNVADGDQRSMTLAEIVASYQAGAVNADTYVWADGMTDWQPLGQVDAIVGALSAGIASPPQEAPGAYAGQPAYGSASMGQVAQPEAIAAAPARAAVRRDPARPSADLFGAGHGHEPVRPSIDDVATSAPLFSSGATAQRDENSMLFSLSALTAKAGTTSSGATQQASGSHDDSGLIDLKALAAGGGAGGASPVASIVADDGGLFQLSAPIVTTAAAPVVVSTVETQPKNRAPVIIGVGIAVAGLAIAGVFFLIKGGGDTAPLPAAEIASPSADLKTAAPPEPEEPAQAPEVTATASAAASASAAAPVAGPRTTSRPRQTGGTTKAPTAPAAPAATAAPKRGSCGCAPGDLMCAMKCSAKGK